MESLAAEILQHIFEQLSSVKDLISCSNTSVKWNQIIKEMYKKNRMILVSSGRSGKIGQYQFPDTVEILDLLNPKFKFSFKDARAARDSPIGGLIQNQPIVCGGNLFGFGLAGEELEIAPIIVLGQPEKKIKMLDHWLKKNLEKFSRDRQHPPQRSGLVIDENTLWITSNHYLEKVTKSEIISWNMHNKQWTIGPELPMAFSFHVVVQVDPKSIYFIGGGGIKCTGEETFIIDPTNNFNIRKGPPMNTVRRMQHAGAKMKINGKIFIVVVGPTNTVEILDTSSPKNGWKFGPELPFQITNPTLTTSPTGKGVILIGGAIGPKLSRLQTTNNVMELSGDSVETLKWVHLENKLEIARENHVSFSIPQDVFKSLNSSGLDNKVYLKTLGLDEIGPYGDGPKKAKICRI